VITLSVQVVQTFRVERSITIQVAVESVEKAEEAIDNGEIEVPNYGDPGWTTDSRSLEHEEIMLL